MPGPRTAFIALLSYAASSVCAAALVLVLLGTAPDDFAGFFLGASLLVLMFACIPFGIAMGVLHALKRRGWVAHTVAGFVVALAAQVIMSPGMLLRPSALLDSWPLPVAGAAAGLIYWLAFQRLDRLLPQDR